MVDYGQKSKINKKFTTAAATKTHPYTVARRFLSWHRKPVLRFGDDAGIAGRSRP